MKIKCLLFSCFIPFHNGLGQTMEKSPIINFTSNPTLRTIKEGWKGTPYDKHHRFVNHEFPFDAKFSEVLKWQFSPKPQKEEKKKDNFRLTLRNDTSFLNSSKDCIIWLGHATFFIRLKGVNILIDPVFYNVPFVGRYSSHAFAPEYFTELDFILVSHDHQDHCQEKSIKALVKLNPKAKLLAGLNMGSLLNSWAKHTPVETAGWYQQYSLPSGISIFYVPSRHWAKRSLNDTNKRLWGGFVIQSPEKTIYFSGDTGYGSHFRDARELFPVIDVAIIGVGAFKPEWFMSPNHISPKDAVKAFHELGAKMMIPMHFGTFDLSDEPVGEPLRILKQLEEEGSIHGILKALDLGENLTDF